MVCHRRGSTVAISFWRKGRSKLKTKVKSQADLGSGGNQSSRWNRRRQNREEVRERTTLATSSLSRRWVSEQNAIDFSIVWCELQQESSFDRSQIAIWTKLWNIFEKIIAKKITTASVNVTSEEKQMKVLPNRNQVVKLAVYSQPVHFLLDSGDIPNVMSDSLAEKLKLQLSPTKRRIVVENEPAEEQVAHLSEKMRQRWSTYLKCNPKPHRVLILWRSIIKVQDHAQASAYFRWANVLEFETATTKVQRNWEEECRQYVEFRFNYSWRVVLDFTYWIGTKMDGSLWFCIDYWKLNTAMKRNRCSMPSVDELSDEVRGRNVFTTLDLFLRYSQIKKHG